MRRSWLEKDKGTLMFFFVHGHRDGVWWRSAKMDRMTEVGGYTPSFEWTLVFIVKKFCLCLLFLLKQISFYFIENCTKRCLICSRENMLKQLRFYIWFENQDGHFFPHSIWAFFTRNGIAQPRECERACSWWSS